MRARGKNRRHKLRRRFESAGGSRGGSSHRTKSFNVVAQDQGAGVSPPQQYDSIFHLNRSLALAQFGRRTGMQISSMPI